MGKLAVQILAQPKKEDWKQLTMTGLGENVFAGTSTRCWAFNDEEEFLGFRIIGEVFLCPCLAKSHEVLIFTFSGGGLGCFDAGVTRLNPVLFRLRRSCFTAGWDFFGWRWGKTTGSSPFSNSSLPFKHQLFRPFTSFFLPF